MLVFVFLFLNSIQETIDLAEGKLGADIIVVPSEAKETAKEYFLGSNKRTNYMDEFVFENIMFLEKIKEATCQVYISTNDSSCCSIDEGQVIAFDQESDFVITSRLADHGGRSLKKGEVYVGYNIYNDLGPINTFTLFDQQVTVAGYLNKTDTIMDNGIFLELDHLNSTSAKLDAPYKQGQISIIFLNVQEGIDPKEVATTISTVFPKLGIVTKDDMATDLKTVSKCVTYIFFISILISSISAVLLVWSTFADTVSERRKESSIHRAIGASRQPIIKMLLPETMVIGSLSSILGIGIGLFLFRRMIHEFPLLIEPDTVAIISLNTFPLLLASFSGVAVCFLGALMSSYRLKP
ncbi:ABC transporter permease [Thermodesulfobacteriota bacterium]